MEAELENIKGQVGYAVLDLHNGNISQVYLNLDGEYLTLQ